MYVTAAVYGSISYLYFSALAVLGSLYVVNLFLAVLWQTCTAPTLTLTLARAASTPHAHAACAPPCSYPRR